MNVPASAYEERWGPFGAVLYRLIIPAGLIGLIFLLFATGMIAHALLLTFLADPIIVLLIAFCGVRSVLLARGAARWFAAGAGATLTAGAAFIAFGLFLASGGV